MNMISFDSLVKKLDFANENNYAITNWDRRKICDKICSFIQKNEISSEKYEDLQEKIGDFFAFHKMKMIKESQKDYTKKIYQIQKIIEKKGLPKINVPDELSPIVITNFNKVCIDNQDDVGKENAIDSDDFISYIVSKDKLIKNSDVFKTQFSNENYFLKEDEFRLGFTSKGIKAFKLLLNMCENKEQTSSDIEKFEKLCAEEGLGNFLAGLDFLNFKRPEFISIESIVKFQTTEKNQDLFDFLLGKDEYELACKVYSASFRTASWLLEVNEEQRLKLIPWCISQREDAGIIDVNNMYNLVIEFSDANRVVVHAAIRQVKSDIYWPWYQGNRM